MSNFEALSKSRFAAEKILQSIIELRHDFSFNHLHATILAGNKTEA